MDPLHAPAVDLDDQEIWDDELLIHSWEDSYKDYKKYHGVGMQEQEAGQSSEPVQNEANEPDQTEANVPDQTEASESIENEANDPNQPEASESIENEANDPNQTEASGLGENNTTSVLDHPPATANLPEPPLPLNDLDDDMKQLLMSWYWAGYYHGLHIGKSQSKK